MKSFISALYVIKMVWYDMTFLNRKKIEKGYKKKRRIT